MIVTTTVAIALAALAMRGVGRLARDAATRRVSPAVSSPPAARRFARRLPVIRRRRPAPSWPAALRLMAREVRSGSALGLAMEVAATAHPDLGALTDLVGRRRVTWSADPATVPASTPDVSQLDDTTDADDRLAIATLTHLLTHGGAMATSLDRAAATIHERSVVAAERDVQAAQARMSARVLSIIAPCFAAWSTLNDPRVRHFLLATAPGLGCLAAGVLCNLAGYRWMGRIAGQTCGLP